jgi:hypothetical protein
MFSVILLPDGGTFHLPGAHSRQQLSTLVHNAWSGTLQRILLPMQRWLMADPYDGNRLGWPMAVTTSLEAKDAIAAPDNPIETRYRALWHQLLQKQ